MTNKVLYIIVAILVLAGVGFYIYNNHQKAPASVVDNSANSTSPAAQQPATTNNSAPATTAAPTGQTNNTPAAPNQGHFSNEADVSGQAQVHQVIYNGTSFNPSSLTIKAGDIVVFKNQSNADFWPASNPHPTHTDYPEFDAKQNIPAGSNYQFKFLKVGTWGYHNHLNHVIGGTIVVTQ